MDPAQIHHILNNPEFKEPEMASWCWICHWKVGPDYRYYKGEKAHPKCIKRMKEKERNENSNTAYSRPPGKTNPSGPKTETGTGPATSNGMGS